MAKPKTIIKKGFSYVTILLIIVIVLTLLFTTYQSIKHPEEPPSLFGYQPYTVQSNSMSPHFKTGDMIIIDKVTPSDIDIHEVITFREDSKVITHRVNNIDKQSGKVRFETKGDNNNVKDDEKVMEDNVIGKQVLRIPKGGYVANFVRSPIGLFLIIALPLAGYLLLEIFGRIKKHGTNVKENSTKN